MAEILTTDGLFVTDNSVCLTRQAETGDISNEEEEALLSEKIEISEEVITLVDMKVYKLKVPRSTKNLSLTCKHTTNLLRISTRVTH